MSSFIVLSHWRLEIQMQRSETDLDLASPSRATHSSEGLEEYESG
jgi:hypothetical protein